MILMYIIIPVFNFRGRCTEKTMLDLFSIFSKGGILLWCFKGAGLLPKEWEAFTPTINELIRSVLLQERAVKKSSWECGQLAVKYKMVTPP